MNYQHTLLLYRAVTPLHVGCGQAVGVVDLPVIRERATGYPFLPGSGIRGSLRDCFEKKRDALTKPEEAAKKQELEEMILTLFGPEADPGADEENKHAGCIALHDARLLFYPVRSDKDVFLWVTCPQVLERFNRDRAAFLGETAITLAGLQNINEQFYIGQQTGKLHLEEFSFSPATNSGNGPANLKTLAGNIGGKIGMPELGGRAVLVSNRSFYHFVNYATMLMQHNTLTSAKTVKDGALFSVESLPPETIFYGMFGATKERRNTKTGKDAPKIKDAFKTTLFGPAATVYLHLGGKESTGLGLTQLTWAN